MLPTNVVAAAADVGEVFSLTAGNSGGQIGYRTSLPNYGSIDPASPPNLHFGVFVLEMDASQSPNFFLEYSPSIIADTDASWRQARVTGTFALGTGSAVYLRANRDVYNADIGGVTRWQFTLDALGDFVSGNVYSCSVER